MLEFDDAYIAAVFGFNNALDYYTKAASKQYLKNIHVRKCAFRVLGCPVCALL
jgi:predicted alpha/beta-fold hydrolase